MSGFVETREGHPAGEDPGVVREVAREAVKVDTFGGTVHVEWDPDAAVTPLGHLAFFAEYLKVWRDKLGESRASNRMRFLAAAATG